MDAEDALVRAIIAVVAVAVLLPALVMILVVPLQLMGWYGGFLWDGGMMGGHAPIDAGSTGPWIGVWLGLVAFVAVVGYVLYRLAAGAAGSGTDEALEELRSAYARGEISYEEFEDRRDQLLGEEP